MITNSNVTSTNLFPFLFRVKWFRINEIRQNIPESGICFCFRFGIRIRMALTLINCTQLRTKRQSSGYPQAQIENHFQFLTASSAFGSYSLAVLLEAKMNRSSAVLFSIFSPSAKTYSCVLLSSHPLSPLMETKSPSHPGTHPPQGPSLRDSCASIYNLERKAFSYTEMQDARGPPLPPTGV